MKDYKPIKIKPLTVSKDLFDDQIKLWDDYTNFQKKILEEIKAGMLDELEPYMEYVMEDDALMCCRTIKGFVRLCKVGKWEPIEGEKWSRCSICKEPVEETCAGDQMLTPHCPQCGAYLGGTYK